MRLYLIIKTVHVLSVVLFLGAGLGSVFYKMRADRSGRIEVIVWAQRAIVQADWLFTVPAGVVLPLTGLWMIYLYQLSLFTPWVLIGISGYTLAGVTWLPAAFLQIRMRKLAEKAYADAAPLPAEFHRYNRIWMALGVPSFFATLFTVWVMIDKTLSFF